MIQEREFVTIKEKVGENKRGDLRQEERVCVT